jgi:predicted RNA-binding Zn ribbon-like protein
MTVSQLKINSIRLVGGLAVLDFLNTCDGRRPGTALTAVVDKLSSLEDVIHWYLHARLITSDEHQQFIALTHGIRGQPLAAFDRLISFREALYRLLLPLALGDQLNESALAVLNAQLVQTAPERLLVSTGSGVVWRWRVCESLESMTASLIGRVAVQAAALLAGPDLARLKVCGLPDCDWLFIDLSKNGRRRWCQMNVCGSREKARRSVASA